MGKSDIFIGFNETLIRDGITALINANGGYQIIGSSLNGDELFKSISNIKFGILIIELGYPNPCNLKYITKIKNRFPELKVLLITSLFKQGVINNFIDLGVDAYILKKCSDTDLFNALEKIQNNEKYYCSSVTQLLLKEFHDAQEDKNEFLTSREIEIMRFLIEGVPNEGIAKKLSISLHTVKTHRKHIMDKFGAKNLISIIRYACRENLIDQENGFFCTSCPYKLATYS